MLLCDPFVCTQKRVVRMTTLSERWIHDRLTFDTINEREIASSHCKNRSLPSIDTVARIWDGMFIVSQQCHHKSKIKRVTIKAAILISHLAGIRMDNIHGGGCTCACSDLTPDKRNEKQCLLCKRMQSAVYSLPSCGYRRGMTHVHNFCLPPPA